MKQQDRYPWFLAALPILLMLLNSAWIYTAPGIDAWIYYGYFFNFRDYNRFFPDAYFGDRLSWILPGYALNEVFPPLVANLILRLLVYYTALFSLYFILKLTLNRRAALLGAVMLGCYTPFLAAVGWNYLDGIGIAYMLLTMCLFTLAARSSRWQVYLFLAGMSYAALVFTNLSLLIFAPLLGIYYLFSNQHERRNPPLPSIVLPILGALGLTILLGLISVAAGGDFVFFASSVSFALKGSNETGNAIAKVPLSDLQYAHHLGVLLVTMVGSSWLVLRYRREHPYAAFFQAYLIAAALIFLLLEVSNIHVLYLFYYANYLMPAVFIALVAQLTVFLPIATLSQRQFFSLLAAGLVIFSLPLISQGWRDVSLSYDDVGLPLLVTTLILVVGCLPLVFRRPEALVIFFIGLAVVGYRSNVLTTVPSNPPTDLVGSDKEFILAVHDGIRAAQKVTEDEPLYFWYPEAQPYYALASAHVNPDSFIGRPFPQIYPWVEIQDGMTVAILSEAEQAVFDLARETLNKRLFDAEYISESQIDYLDSPIKMTFIQVRACSNELPEQPTEFDNIDAVVFYPAQDYAAQLAAFPAQHDCLILENEQTAHYNLFAIFQQIQDEVALDLDADGQAALTAWRADKLPDHLQDMGVEYVMLTSEWLGWLTDAEKAIFKDESQYKLIERWRFENVDMVYSLYQVEG